MNQTRLRIRSTTTSNQAATLPPPGEPDLGWVDRVNLKIEYHAPVSLTPAPRNARAHSKKQIEQIAASIRQFGFVNPILVDADGVIVAGHGRAEAAKLLKMKSVPTVRLDHLSAAERRAYLIADNRLAELANWDHEILAIELGELSPVSAFRTVCSICVME